jgi:hypothetical protein
MYLVFLKEKLFYRAQFKSFGRVTIKKLNRSGKKWTVFYVANS